MSGSRRWSRLGLLTLGAAVAAGVGASGRSHEIGPFGGPLFGLEASRHGKLLVADASVGIIPARRGAPIALPGITDVSVRRGTTWAVTGANPALGGPLVDSGQGVHIVGPDGPQKIVNLFEFEATNNPHPANGVPDSNPFDVHALGSHAALVADAGGNDLLRVDRWGNVKVLAIFPTEVVSTANIKALAGCTPESIEGFCGLPPEIPAQAVPTSIAVDHRGYIYVGELKGFPAPTGESNIWRVSPRAENAACGVSPDCVKVFDGGFTSIIDLALGPDGNLYVVEFDEASWAAVEIPGLGPAVGGTINACNVKRGNCRKVARGIPEVTAIAFDDDDDLWATRHALVPGEAEVIEIRRRHDHKRDHRWSWRKHD